MFKNNVGSADRVVRIIIGLVLIGAGVYLKAWWGVIGLVPLATATMGYCPLYSPLGINTCKKT